MDCSFWFKLVQKMKINKIVEEIFIRIEKIQLHIESVLAAVNYLGRDVPDRGDIVEKLYARQNKEWQDLFMFGMVVDEKTRERIRAAAYEHFLNDHMHIASYFGTTSGGWLLADEEEFRRMCKELFAPKEAKELNSDALRELGLKEPSLKPRILK